MNGNGPFAAAVAACRYGLAAPWTATGAAVEAFDSLDQLAARIEQLRRGRALTWSTGQLVWGGDEPVVRRTVVLGVLAGEKVSLDLRLFVQGEPLAGVRAAVEAAADPRPH